MTLPFSLRSDITRATFHALEGEPALVPAIAARIEAGLAALDPTDAPGLKPRIGAALHQVMMPSPSTTPWKRLVFARRRARLMRYRQVMAERRLTLAERHPALAWVMLCDPDPAVAERARLALGDPPSPFHAALARTAG